jgi:TolB-like protein
MSLFDELKRRRVFKVAAAYVVVAWLAVQAASIGFPAFDAPAWAIRVFILVVALGFPLALVLAWAFDITPEGVRLEAAPIGNKRVYSAAAIFAALAVVWYVVQRPAPQGQADAHSIAVLPFVNMSADPAQEFFSDGIAEELLNQLAQSPDLMVAARTSAFQFKGRNLDIADIGRKLNVAHVLEGSVRKEGTRLRITAQLIKVATGFHLWSQTFERDAADVFKVQDEISTAIAKALEAKLSGRTASAALPRTADPAAYDDYLQARTLVAHRLGDSIPQAIAAYDRAIARDPSYSAAHSGRAFALLLAPIYTGSMTVAQAVALAFAGSEQALGLDGGNAEAHLVRGTVHSIRFEEVAARTDFDRALALAPGSVDVLNFAGDNFEHTANLRAAERMKRQAMALDPLSFVHPMDLAPVLRDQGRLREALAMNERAAQLGAGRIADSDLIWAHLRLGDIGKAREMTTSYCKTEDSGCLLVRIALLAAAGEQRELDVAKATLAASESSWLAGRVFPDDVATLYANYAIDIPRATAAVVKSLQDPTYQITHPLYDTPRGARLPEEISQDPDWLAAWSDPRLRETMAAYRTNLAAFRNGE